MLYCDGVDLTFEGPDAREFKGTKRGRIYLTTHRMVFTNKDTKDTLQSFSFPFHTVTNLELEQPIFGANYIKGAVKAEPNGNWTGHCTFKLKFMKGGAIEFGQAMIEAAKSASRYTSGQAPPPYTAPTGPYYCPPPPAYMPPPNAQYGFTVPSNVFPDAPPANTVFMTDMPPPYPGVNSPAGYPGGQYPQQYPPPGQQQYPQPGQQQPGAYPGGTPSANAKAAEAAQSAYYNPSAPSAPSAPGYGYAPPPPGFAAAGDSQPQGPPPPYSEHSKKTN